MFDSILQSLAASASGIAVVPLLLLLFVGSSTPGPNIILLLAAGSRVGFRRTLPQMAGMVAGYNLFIVLQGVFLTQLFSFLPWTVPVLRVVFSAVLLRLAWGIATAPPLGDGAGQGRLARFSLPLKFHHAFAFQYVNPKAWAVIPGIFAAYGSGDPDRVLAETLFIVALSLPVTIVAWSTWAAGGAALRTFLGNERRARIFNRVMGATLLLALVGAWV